MKKTFFFSLAILVLTSCSGVEVTTGHLSDELRNEANSSGFTELCSEKGGSVEVASDVYCTLDYNGDGTVDSSEYCSYSNFAVGACSLDILASDDNLVVENSENIGIHNPSYLRAEGTREVYLTAELKAVLDIQGGKAILNFLEKGQVSAIQDLSFDVYNSEFFFLELYYVGDQNILLNNWDPNSQLSYYFFDGTAWTKLPVIEKIEKYLSENYPGYRTNSFWSSAQDIVGEIPGNIDISVSFNPTPSTPPRTLSLSFDPMTDEVKASTRLGY